MMQLADHGAATKGMVEAQLLGSGEAVLRAMTATELAYQQALRHSRQVRLMRKLIPAICLSAIAIMVVGPYLNPFRAVAGLGSGTFSLSGTKVTMDNPTLTGFRKDNKPYELTARTAIQDLRKPNVIELNLMNARLQMEADSWARLEAMHGIYDTQKEQMQLRDGVKLKTDGGYDVTLKSADLDFKAGTIISNEAVTVKSGETTINAATLDVTDNGRIISFRGKVSVVVENSGMALSPGADATGARKP
jgi:lipopolysaccharide export system protein LptC